MPARTSSGSSLLRQWSSCFGIGSLPLDHDDLAATQSGTDSALPAASSSNASISADEQEQAQPSDELPGLPELTDCWASRLSPDSYGFMTGSDNECGDFLSSPPTARPTSHAPPMVDMLAWAGSNDISRDAQCMSCPAPSTHPSPSVPPACARPHASRTMRTSSQSCMPVCRANSTGLAHAQSYTASGAAPVTQQHPERSSTACSMDLLFMIKEGSLLFGSPKGSAALESGRLSVSSACHGTGYDGRDSGQRGSGGRASSRSAALYRERVGAADRLARAISGLCTTRSMNSMPGKPEAFKATGSCRYRTSSDLALAAHSVTSITRHLMGPSLHLHHGPSDSEAVARGLAV